MILDLLSIIDKFKGYSKFINSEFLLTFVNHNTKSQSFISEKTSSNDF
jgi:hypothetical protein